MPEILKTIQLEYKKSSFLIDLVQHTSNEKYVQIVQTISVEGDNSKKQSVKFNKKMLEDVIRSLMTLMSDIDPDIKIESLPQSKNAHTEVVKRYLNGIKIPDLAFQFGLKEKVIEQILRNSNIEIVDQEVPNYLKKGFRKSGRRRR